MAQIQAKGNKMNRKSCYAVVFACVLIGLLAPAYFLASPFEKSESVEARLLQLQDREEIRQLLNDYGRYLDQRDFASFSQLFAEKEGEWIGGMGKAKGRQAIKKLMDETIGNDRSGKIGGPNYHLFMNESINVRGNEGTAVTKWVFVVQNDAKRPEPFYLGHYEDSLVREQGRWRFLKRVVYGDIPADNPLAPK